MAANDSLIPSSYDLLLVVPRLARRMASLAAAVLPDQEIKNAGSIIADATSSLAPNTTAAFAQNTSLSAAAATTAAAAAAAAAATNAPQRSYMSYLSIPFSPDGIRGFGGMFAYIGSRWALTTFAISIFLNRTQFYASSRQNISLRWHTRLLLYSTPILIMLLQIFWILEALKCQTSPDYPQFRYRDAQKRLAINFGGDGGPLHALASTVLSWKTDAECCQDMNMSLVDNKRLDVMGSFSLLWPLFLTLCFSQFIETLYCSLQGRQPLPETGMSLFEHSLAFAECEAMITSAVGLGFFTPSKPSISPPNSTHNSESSAVLLTKSMILQRLNVPSEVLLIALISCLSHVSSSLLAITGQRHRFRLVNTAIWAFCYMAAFCWSLAKTLTGPIDPDDLGILRFPTVCIIGFIPHMLILVGIFVCSLVYAIALLLTAMSLPPSAPPNPSLKERFSLALHNMQANVQFSSASSIRLNWHEDFYTVLLKIGFNVLTAASEAVYLNEGSRIQIHSMTWLEEERIQELAAVAEHRRKTDIVPPELLDESIAKGLSFTDFKNVPSMSGFATERRSKSAQDTTTARAGSSDGGLGIAERRGRWQLSFDFLKGMLFLFARISSRFLLALLSKFGIEGAPAWLRRAADYRQSAVTSLRSRKAQRAQTPDFWLVSDEGVLSLPENGNIDVEVEMRRRLRAARGSGADAIDEAIDADLYGWWKRGGWWGDLDTSGDYETHEQDDDTTSMISMSTNAPSEAGFDDEDSGRRTPTQDDYVGGRREETPEPTMGTWDLARLLDPKTAADREEAQMLSRHLLSEQSMTRSQYRRRLDRERARVLEVPYVESAFSERGEGTRTKAEEAEALEKFLLERRAATQHQQSGPGGTWDSGGEGMGSSGPQCVVCQCSPRVIVAWPCGCLCVCDDCRVGVATRNFVKCMCCRTKVVAYSRLYVP